jgi:hypothetical protein
LCSFQGGQCTSRVESPPDPSFHLIPARAGLATGPALATPAPQKVNLHQPVLLQQPTADSAVPSSYTEGICASGHLILRRSWAAEWRLIRPISVAWLSGPYDNTVRLNFPNYCFKILRVKLQDCNKCDCYAISFFGKLRKSTTHASSWFFVKSDQKVGTYLLRTRTAQLKMTIFDTDGLH